MSSVVNSIASSSRSLLRRTPLASRALSTAPEQTSSAPTSAPAAASAASILPAAFRSQTPNPPSSTTPSSTTPTTRFSSSASTYVPTNFSSARREYNPYKLHVFSTRNNTILTLTHTPGFTSPTSIADQASSAPHNPVAWVSGGSAGYKGAARGTYDAAVEVSLRMIKKVEELVDPPIGSGGQKRKVKSPAPTELEVIWKGFGQGRDAVFRSLMGGEGEKIRHLVKRVTDATPLKIGGTRAKKRRVI
ncbi:hypothetical protein RQP46_000680 [Phenoliferia psychrophenolica]